MNRAAAGVLCWTGLIVFTAYLLVVNRDYYRADTQAPTYDEAWYLETSLHLYHRLTGEGLRAFWEAYTGAFGVKAPLISVLPLPLYLIFGASHYPALLVNSVFIVITNLYLFLLARRLFDAPVGLAAVVYYQTMPLAYGLSRNVMAEYGLAALVVVWMYYLVASEGLSRDRFNLAMGVVLGLGMLMKILFAAFVAGPLVWAWIRRDRERPAWIPLAQIGLPALAIAGTWYAHNWRSLIPFAWESAYGGIAPEYSAGGLKQWALLVVNQGLSLYYAAALAVLGLAARPWRAWRDERATLLLAWLLPPLAAIAAGRNQLIRFVLPLLPVFAIALAVAVFRLGGPWIAQAALAVVLAVFPQRLFAALSYPAHGDPGRHATMLGPFVLFARDLGWARPPVREDPWEHRRLVEAIRRMTPDADRPFYVVLAVDHVYLNANLLNYVSAYSQYPMRFTSLGYGESSAERAVERILSLDARFLILGEGFRNLPEFLNRVNDEIRGKVERGELPFRRRVEVALAEPMKAVVYERETRWTSGPAEPSRRADQVLAPGVRLVGFDWNRRHGRLWELRCYWKAEGAGREEYRVEIEFRRGQELVSRQEYFVTGGRHPMPEWQPGEVVRETRLVYGDPTDARVRLVRWGVGPPGPEAALRLEEQSR